MGGSVKTNKGWVTHTREQGMHEEDVRVFLSRGLFPGVGYRLARDGPAGKEASYSYYGPRQPTEVTEGYYECMCVYLCMRVYECLCMKGHVNQHPLTPIDLHN